MFEAYFGSRLKTAPVIITDSRTLSAFEPWITIERYKDLYFKRYMKKNYYIIIPHELYLIIHARKIQCVIRFQVIVNFS